MQEAEHSANNAQIKYFRDVREGENPWLQGKNSAFEGESKKGSRPQQLDPEQEV